MTYTARLNVKIVLPSGNWFSGFKADAESRTVVYTYHDRRRAGQVARHYTVMFKADLSTIESVTAVSAHGGRVEHFKTVSIRDDLAIILRAAKREAFEESLEQNEQDNEKSSITVVVETLVNKMGIVVALFAVIAFILTLCFFFGEASVVDAVMKALVGAEIGALVALFAVNIAMEVKHHK